VYSETLTRQIIKGKRDQIILSTKGGSMGHTRKPEPIYDRPEKEIQACEDILKRLQTDYIDLYFCHNWWHVEQETEAFLTAFDQLKRDGKVRAVIFTALHGVTGMIGSCALQSPNACSFKRLTEYLFSLNGILIIFYKMSL
jgi:aryl-alcohol dehydrogenase-like predicted oxidoreductase